MESWSHSAEHCANKLLTCCYWQISENISNKWYFSATCILKTTAIIYKITSYGYMEFGEAFCEQLRLWTVWSLRWNHLDPFNPCRHIWQSWIFVQFLDGQILWIHIFSNICYNLNYFCGISIHHSVCLAIFCIRDTKDYCITVRWPRNFRFTMFGEMYDLKPCTT